MDNNLNTYLTETNTYQEITILRNCAICGDPMTYNIDDIYLCVCDKCKQAVMYIREQLD